MSDNKENLYKDFIQNITKQDNPTYNETPKINGNISNKLSDISIPEFNYTYKNKVNDDFKNIKEYYLNNKSKYEEIYIEQFPLNFMYNPATRILIRACTVSEIQDYSTYDENNSFEFRKKLDDIFRSCVIILDKDDNIIDPDNIMDNDKFWIVLTIREKTFPLGKKLSVKVSYKEDDILVNDNIEIDRSTIDVYTNEPIMEYFDDSKKCFIFETTFGGVFNIAPPTVGVRKSFDNFLIEETKSKKVDAKKDESFYKIAPYILPGRTHISNEELGDLKDHFRNKMSTDEYFFLYDLIYNQLNIGIRGLKKNKGNGIIKTRKYIPDNTKDIFFISGGFNLFIKR